MSDAKRQQLIEQGRFHPDGTRIEVCPTCHRPFAQGEGLPVGPNDAVAEAAPVEASAAAPAPGQEV